MPLVALLGGECTGKTSLATGLASHLNGLVVPEYVRAFVDEHGRIPIATEQRSIFDAQRRAIDEARTSAPNTWIIADPAAAMTAIYSQVYFDDTTLHGRARTELAGVDAVLWCDVDLPWEADGPHRDGPHMRRAAHAAITEFVRTTPGIEVTRLSGGLDQRITTALDALGV
jgi:nicotinamide riboside kinase